MREQIKWIRFPCKGGIRLKALVVCPGCGKKRWIRNDYYNKAFRDGTYTGLCKSCRCTQHIGEKNPNWRGGISTRTDGYRLVKIDEDHPFYCMADHQGYARENRLVVAQHIGRPLTDEETVHHIDGNRVNNDIENLRLFPSNGDHIAYHHAQQKLLKAV